MTTVAILGTGKMGGAMARRLASSGFDVVLWNRTRARAEALNVGRVVDSPADAARSADVVISSLTNDTAVRDVYLGDHGVLRVAGSALLIDASTAGPEVAMELGREAAARRVPFVEAPVVGSVPAVESGKLLILAGGTAADVERARPVLEHLGEVHHAGDPATAQRLKLVANSMLGITTAAAAELLAAGTAVGLAREEVFAILVRFAPGLAARERGLVQDQHTPAMFAVRDLLKDLDLALHAYGSAGVATPLTREVEQRFSEAMRDSADLDITAVGRHTPALASAAQNGGDPAR
jgi:3-hydroxyisobutyrate dehydrogenase